MRMLGKLSVALAAGLMMGVTAMAQTRSVAVGAAFDYDHANLVQGCNCFGLYGGAAEVQFGLARRVFLLGDVAVARQSGLTPDGYMLTQSTYMGGLRYAPLQGERRLRPFADAMAGLAHAGGSLSPAKTGYGSANAFGLQLGGGLKVGLSPRWELVPVQAEYLLTTFTNGGTNVQNQLRLSAGLLYRWKK